MKKKRMVIFIPGRNTPGKKDVTGAFEPEAERYLETVCDNESEIVRIDNGQSFARRRKAVLEVLAEDRVAKAFDGVAFFCHGWKSGIQLGFNNKDVHLLAAAIDVICGHSFPVVPLYCCSTGGDIKSSRTSPGTGDDSFADRLRDALCFEISKRFLAPYCRVMAHETVAHATKNPRVRFFDGMGSPDGGVGGYRPVRPSGLLWNFWVKELRNRNSDFRFWMPHMSIEEIAAWLQEL